MADLTRVEQPTEPHLGPPVALITGAAGGIGRATVARLLSAGFHVVAFDSHEPGLTSASAEWNATDRVSICAGAVEDPGSVDAAVEVACSVGRLAAVVTCAGVMSQRHYLEDYPEEEWRRMLNVNLRGNFLVCRAAARAMLPHRSGSIVTISSGAAWEGVPQLVGYVAAKGGITGLTKSLAVELAPHGIRANCIAPGGVDTPMPRGSGSRTEEQIYASLINNPMHRLGVPDDIADLVLFLVSQQSSHITGQELYINAGQLRP
jgi:NAD(P)-dependent dehydrogenase (short-subunit alcohol dehydrogenase family)